ncbi:aminoacyl tRNA synthase complex-interacting multifunctional protein 1-like [Acanthochromis polyacanthus]|uniref:aminoacyl tRNA synthase complex-interacting multifunctional protein 1-like n=1 Tax=Acanthochromis polyacanthus TaxID=80966 RepID=UPI002234688D|nr:aminoacyl tRNA synthase complex-interacting multifunctional protein 1-like [Acanthochromis polyacanthus]
MSDSENVFPPSLSAALLKLDPEDGEQIMEYLKTHVLLSREKALLQASVREQKKLLVENAKLKKDIEQLRVQLQEKQRRRTGRYLLAPPPPSLSPAPAPPVVPAAPAEAPPTSSQVRREKCNRRRRARPVSDPLRAEPPVDVSRLDLRVGRILSVRRHPLADGLTVQEVEVGEDAPRTVVSKLGEKTHLEQLPGSLVVLLCNVKPCKLRGVASQARLLCCSSPDDDDLALLLPPSGSAPGDRVTVTSYHGDPDHLLPSGLWQRLQVDLQVDGGGVASYKGGSLQVKGKGRCRGPALTCCCLR